jgi:hypothetical protein
VPRRVARPRDSDSISQVVRGAKAPISVEELVKVHLVNGIQLPPDVVCHQEEVLSLCLVPVQVAVKRCGQKRVVCPERVVVGQRRAVKRVLELPDARGEGNGLDAKLMDLRGE